MIKVVVMVIFSSLFSSAFAEDREACDILLSGSQEQVYHAFFKSYQKNFEDGLGQRGFLGSAVPKTPQTDLMALEYGIIWWGMKFNIVPTIEEAVAHRQAGHELHKKKGTLYTDVLVAGLYILGEESELGLTFDKEGPGAFSKTVSPEKVEMLMKRGAYEIQSDGSYSFVPPERLLRRVSFEGVSYYNVANLPGAFGRNSISQSGWVAFKQHGLHDYSKWKQTDAAKRLKKLARKLVEQGYTIRFNSDYKLMLDKLKDQKRTFRPEKKEGASEGNPERTEAPAEHNRYRNEAVYNTALANLMAGKGYSVGVYTPAGELVAGEIGWRVGNHVYGDSVFYDGDVNLAKISALALMEVMDAAGQPYTDPGMITAYTGSMGAELVPFPEFIQKIKSGPQERIEFPSVWNPMDEAYLDKKFDEIQRRRSQAFSSKALVSRLPVPSSEARAIAAKFGVERRNLDLVILPSIEAIKQHASQFKNPQDVPIYLVTPQNLSLSLPASDYLRQALSLDGAKVYSIHHPKFVDDIRSVDLKKLSELLNLEVQADPPQWTWALEGGVPRISLGFWAVPKAK